MQKKRHFALRTHKNLSQFRFAHAPNAAIWFCACKKAAILVLFMHNQLPIWFQHTRKAEIWLFVCTKITFQAWLDFTKVLLERNR